MDHRAENSPEDQLNNSHPRGPCKYYLWLAPGHTHGRGDTMSREYMLSVPRCLGSAVLAGGMLWGQALRVSPSTAERNTTGSFSIRVESPSAKTLVALQWDLVVPPALAIGTSDILIGRTAETAHKSLTCAQRSGKDGPPRGVRYSCILAGGRQPIGNGPIATVRYRSKADVGGAPIRVAIERVVGVSADLKRLDIPNVDALVKVR